MIWGQAVKNWGQLGAATFSGKLGRTAAGAAWGGTLGGLYGAMSSNTSVLGGIAMGAGLGAGGARYGGAGLKRANMVGAGMGVKAHGMAAASAFGKGAFNRLRLDYRGASMMANKGYNKIRGIGR